MPSTVIFELPATKGGIVLKEHAPLTVVTTSWTGRGHPGGKSTTISYVDDLKGNRGITDSGASSFEFDIGIDEVIERDARGETIDLRGRMIHKT